MEKIKKMWIDFVKMQFPNDYAGVHINNICVTSLDTYAAGCIDTYITSGILDNNMKKILLDCLIDLQSILPNLEGYSKDYFTKLKLVCEEIMRIN